MDSYQQINQIPILDILDKLNIWYQKVSDVYSILEDWKATDWWKINVKENYVNDFSWKCRAVWDPYCFVRSYLWITNKETFEWFQDNFSITTDLTKKTKKKTKPTKNKTKKCSLPNYRHNR